MEGTSSTGLMGMHWEKVRMARGSHHLIHETSLRSPTSGQGWMRRDSDRQTCTSPRTCEQQRQGENPGLCGSPCHPLCHLYYTIVNKSFSKKSERNRDRMSHLRSKCALFLISVRGTVSPVH